MSELQSVEEIALGRLYDLGIRSASYKWSISFVAMINSVKVVQEHGSRLPEAIKADLEIKFFYLFTHIENIQDMLRPNAIYEINKSLLTPEAPLT
jgi:hypothetical protein